MKQFFYSLSIVLVFFCTTTATGQNRAPVAKNDVKTTLTNLATEGNVLTNDLDLDGNNLSATLLTQPLVGSLSFSGGFFGSYTYTPSTGFTGTTFFTYQVCDNAAAPLCDTGTVVISVINPTNANDIPVGQFDAFIMYQNTSITVDVTNNDIDPDGDLLTLNAGLVTSPSSGTATVNTATGEITYTPNPGFVGADNLLYLVCDPSGSCVTTAVKIDVLPTNTMVTNSLPLPGDDAFLGNMNAPITGNVLRNDTDTENDPLILATLPISNPDSGTLVLNIDGTFTYTPDSGFCGSDQFVYEVCDNGPVGNPCTNATVHLVVLCSGGTMIVNNPPNAVNDNYTTTVNTMISGNVLTNDFDIDGNVFIANTTLPNPPSNGTVTIQASGIFDYTPNTGFIGIDSFSYSICDGGTPILCDTAWVSITVQQMTTCPTIDSVQISQPTCGNTDGNITLSASGGTGNYLFSLDSGITWSSAPTFSNLGGGSYYSAVSDSDTTCVTYHNQNPIVLISLQASDTTFVQTTSCDSAQTGIATFTFTNQSGCDSVVVTTTTFSLSDTTNIQLTTCDTSQIGVSTITMTNQSGCDSVIVRTTIFAPADSTFIQNTTCDTSQIGVSTITMTNQSGCDSVIVRTTVFAPADSTFIQNTTCDTSQVGTSTVVLTGQSGCDSVLVVTTSLSPISDTIFVQVTTCDTAQLGVSVTTMTGQNGCDSVTITTTTLAPSDTIFVQAFTCDSAHVGTSTMIIPNQTGCDSVIITTTSFIVSDTTMLQNTTCDPQQAGVSIATMTNQNGCDSVIITTTLLLSNDTTNIQLMTCDSSQVGVNSQLFTNQAGCDSLVITSTVLMEIDTTFNQATTCDINQVGTTAMTFTAQNGCDSVVVTTTTLLGNGNTNVLLTTDTTICEGASVQLEAVLGGIIYDWSNGSTLSDSTVFNPFATPTITTTYHLVVSNGMGCTDSSSVTVTVLAGLDLTTTVISDVACFGGDDGAAMVNVSNGIAPFTYTWSNGETVDLATNLSGGINTVLVTDAMGCTDSASVTIQEPTSGITITPTVTDAPCNTNTGSATVVVTGGTAPYTYLWSNGSDSATAVNLTAGQYIVTVSDDVGCSVEDTLFVSFTNIPIVTETITDVSCYNGNDGAIDLTVTSGAAPYTFQWSSSSDSTEDRTNLTAGLYGVLIIDANGCIVLRSYSVNDFNTPFLVDTTLVQPSCAGSDGSAGVTVTSGDGPYSYLWNTGDTTAIITGLGQGFYSLTVTDVNGCTFDYNFQMIPIGAPTASFTVAITDSLVEITNTSTAGIAYQWTFENGDTSLDFEPTVIYDSSDVYMITLIVSNNCGTDTFSMVVDVHLLNANSLDFSENVLLAPNPTSGNFRLEMDGLPTGKWNIQVHNLAGQVLQHQVFDSRNYTNTLYFDIQNQPEGMYLLHLRNEKGAFIVKKVLLIKQ